MTGAAYLAAMGALRCGAGIVTLGVPQSVYLPIASKLNECLVYPLAATPAGSFAYSNLEAIQEMAKKTSVMLLGCGLSLNEETKSLVRDIVGSLSCPIILDADGINAFEGHIDLLRTSKAELILTPHPGEMSRLCGKPIAEIQRNRLDTAREFAKEYGVTLVLKGANTVVAAKDGWAFINPTGNPGMAKGGSGDILAGMTTALTAQGIEPVKAACCAVFIHGLAGDLCAEKLSQYGMLPSDMLMEIPQIFRDMSR
jgi:NAD(P)H-hydrate epimerase